jgi:hypothetical protein
MIYSMIHTIKLKLWYLDADGGIRTVSHYGHTDFVYKDSYGIKTDSEAPKKSLTDALKKCLSMLGFSADVFMGKFDDHLYLEEATNKAALEKADNKAEEKSRQMAEYQEWLKTHADLLATASNLNELRKIFSLVIRKLEIRHDQESILKMTKIKDKRKAELDNKEPEQKAPTNDKAIRNSKRVSGTTEP